MKPKVASCTTIALGAFLAAAGLCLLKMRDDPQVAMRVLPYACLAVGAVLFGRGVGNALSERAVGDDPELKRQLDIERHDERNVAIANLAKAKAFDRMVFVYGVLLVVFALMGVDMVAVVLLMVAYLLVQGIALYYRFKFGREM